MTDPEVKVPGTSVDPAGTDVAKPTSDLLVRLELLPKPDDAQASGPIKGTPYSLQVISAGALALNKWWTAAIAALGGGSAIFAGLKGFWSSEADSVRVAVILGSALALSAVAISIALIVRGDTAARGQASAAQFAARAQVVSGFLGLTGGLQLPTAESVASKVVSELLPVLAAHKHLTVRGDDMDGDVDVKGVRRTVDGSLELLTDGDWVALSKIKTFTLDNS